MSPVPEPCSPPGTVPGTTPSAQCDDPIPIGEGLPVAPQGVTAVKDCESVQRKTHMRLLEGAESVTITADEAKSVSVVVIEADNDPANQPTFESTTETTPVPLVEGLSFTYSAMSRHNDTIEEVTITGKATGVPSKVYVIWTE